MTERREYAGLFLLLAALCALLAWLFEFLP